MTDYRLRRDRRGRSSVGGGVALIVIGILFFLNQAFGISVVGSALSTIGWSWPLILVALGVVVLLRRDPGTSV